MCSSVWRRFGGVRVDANTGVLGLKRACHQYLGSRARPQSLLTPKNGAIQPRLATPHTQPETVGEELAAARVDRQLLPAPPSLPLTFVCASSSKGGSARRRDRANAAGRRPASVARSWPRACGRPQGGERARAQAHTAMAQEQFYLRYYVGHMGKFGHEYLEFEFRPDGEVCVCRAQGVALRRACPRARVLHHHAAHHLMFLAPLLALLRCLRVAALQEQLAVQERHRDPQEGVRVARRAGGAQAHHRGQRGGAWLGLSLAREHSASTVMMHTRLITCLLCLACPHPRSNALNTTHQH